MGLGLGWGEERRGLHEKWWWREEAIVRLLTGRRWAHSPELLLSWGTTRRCPCRSREGNRFFVRRPWRHSERRDEAVSLYHYITLLVREGMGFVWGLASNSVCSNYSPHETNTFNGIKYQCNRTTPRNCRTKHHLRLNNNCHQAFKCCKRHVNHRPEWPGWAQ